MATIKPDIRLKELLIKQESARRAKRAIYAKALTTLLASLPQTNPAAVQLAVDALMEAADQYKASQPLVDLKGRRSKPSIAEARASVKALHKHLVKAQEQLSNLPLDAMSAICQVTDASLGKLKSDMAQMCLTAEKALAELAARPHKEADATRRVLAYQVAVVFRDILKIAPSSAQAKQLKEINSRGGAAYDRVLRATLKAAGVTDYDPGPLITTGLRLLKNPLGNEI